MGPSVAKPETCVGQFYDGEAFTASAGWTPGAPRKQNFARGFLVTTGGTMTVDFLGVNGGAPGNTSVAITVVANTMYQIAITQIHAGGTAAGIVVY